MCDHHSTSQEPALPLSPECLRYYDDLRLSPDEVLSQAVSPPSNVVRMTVTTNGTSYRLGHLTSMLPSTYDGANLQPDFGLYTEGAGLLAVIDFNNRNDSIVPEMANIRECDMFLTMEFQDTQFSPIEASRILTQDVLLRRTDSLPPPPISMVGATRSAVTGPLAVVGGIHELPIVSYGSTSSQLDNTDSYPYFGRTVPTNKGDAVAAVSYLRNVLGVTHCGVLFVKDGYGLAYHKEFVHACSMLDDPPMKLVSASYDPNNRASIVSAVDTIRRSRYKYIFGIISTPTYNAVMQEAYNARIAGVPGVAWFLSEASGQLAGNGFGFDASTEADIASATNGVGVISLDIAENDAFVDAWKLLEGNAALKDYFVSKHDEGLNFSDFVFPDSPSFWEALQYDAVMAIGLAACGVTDDFFTGPSLFDAFVQTSFEGASGIVDFDNRTGTRNYSSLSYMVVNIVARSPNENNKISFESTKTSYQEGLEWIQAADFVFPSGTTKAPPSLPRVAIEIVSISDAARIFGLALSGIIIFLSVGFAIWTSVNRKTVVVRVTQPFFLDMICIGTFLMGSAIVFMSFQEPLSETFLDIACMIVPWLLSLGFVISFSALLSKTIRITKLVTRSRQFRRQAVKVRDVMVPFLILFTLNVSILVSWTAVDPLRWERIGTGSVDQYGRSIEAYGTCQSSDPTLQLVFYVLLCVVDVSSLLLANVANYRARKISGALHDASYLTTSAAIMLEATVIGIPALLVVGTKPTESFIVRSILVTIVCAAILLPLYIPKMRQARESGYRTRGTRLSDHSSVSKRSLYSLNRQTGTVQH